MSVQLAEKIEEHCIEPELLLSAPRRIRTTYWSRVGFVACVAGFCSIAACIFSIGLQSARLMWLAQNGRTVSANVVSCTFLNGSTGACETRPTQIASVNYVFNVGSIRKAGSMIYDAKRTGLDFQMPSRYTAIAPPHILLLRYGILDDKLLYSLDSSTSIKSAGFALIGSVLAGVFCLFVTLHLVSTHLHLRAVVTRGIPVIGTIKEKTITDDDGPRYFVIVGYMDHSGHGRQFKERCTPDQWRKLAIGQPVTVLSMNAHRMSNLIYVHSSIKCA